MGSKPFRMVGFQVNPYNLMAMKAAVCEMRLILEVIPGLLFRVFAAKS